MGCPVSMAGPCCCWPVSRVGSRAPRFILPRGLGRHCSRHWPGCSFRISNEFQHTGGLDVLPLRQAAGFIGRPVPVPGEGFRLPGILPAGPCRLPAGHISFLVAVFRPRPSRSPVPRPGPQGQSMESPRGVKYKGGRPTFLLPLTQTAHGLLNLQCKPGLPLGLFFTIKMYSDGG